MKFKKIRIILIVCLALFNQLAFSKIQFEQKIIQTNFTITHDIKFANLLDLPNNQLFVLGENEDAQRLLVVYELLLEEQHYSEVSRLVIPNNFLAFDVMKTAAVDKLVFMSQDQLFEYVAVENTFKNLSPISSFYLQENADFLVDKDFIKDINNDNLDDIVIADFKSVHLLLQQKSGQFIRQELAIKPTVSLEENEARFSESTLHFADTNFDNNHDIIIVQDKQLAIYQQLLSGQFSTTPVQTELAINVSALNWWQVKQADGETIDQSNLSHRTVFKITDVNNDNISDLIVLFNQTDGVLDRQNNYEIYLGQRNEQQWSFNKKPDSTISAEGTISKFEFIDLNNDQLLEVLVSSLDIGISQIIGALLSGSIDQDVYIFTMDKNGQYNNDPELSKEVELNFSLSSGRRDDPVIKLADFNGDGFKDLLFSDGDEKLLTYQATQKKKLFQRKSAKHKVSLPKNGQYLSLYDLDRDGKQDILIRYGRQDDKKLSQQFRVLFSR